MGEILSRRISSFVRYACGLRRPAKLRGNKKKGRRVEFLNALGRGDPGKKKQGV